MQEQEGTFQELLNAPKDKLVTNIPFKFTEIEIFLQPIINLHNFEIPGYEAFIELPFEKGVDYLFKRAQEYRILFKASRGGLSSGHLLFLDIHPIALSHEPYYQEVFQRLIRQLGVSPKLIVSVLSTGKLKGHLFKEAN